MAIVLGKPVPQTPATPENGRLEDVVAVLLAERPGFQAFLRRRVADESAAEDLLQQALVKAVQHHRTLKKRDSAVAWFYRILRRALTDYYRSEAADSRRRDQFSRDLRAAEKDLVPSLDESRPTVCLCMERLLPGLNRSYADLVRRVDLEEEPLQDVAKELGITPNNATVRLHRARKALKQSLEQACGVCSKHGCLNCSCE